MSQLKSYIIRLQLYPTGNQILKYNMQYYVSSGQ